MKIFWFVLTIAVCSCRSSRYPVESLNKETEVLVAIAQAIDASYTPSGTPMMLSKEEIEFLKGISILDPLSVVHPRHYDQIKSIESLQVERFYYNYSGNVSHSETISLNEDEFWLPLKLLVQYYLRFGRLPVGSELSVPMLKGALTQKRNPR